MKRVIVLGGGRVGSLMARDMSQDKDIDVTVVDVRKEIVQRLEKEFGLKALQADLSIPENVTKLVRDYDLVIGAVPGFMGFQTLRAVIDAGVNCCDISFMPEDSMQLDKVANEHNVTVVVDCGVAPGLSNMLVGHADSLLDKTEKVVIMVGGLPKIREWPYEYKAVFSPIDVIEEYTRPAKFVRNGKIIIMPALTEIELIEIPGIGKLEAFNTDGLRSLMHNIHTPNMVEKTLRYPGHAERMRMLRETGFFEKEPIDVKGTIIRPIDMTTKLLFPLWKMKPDDRDITVMRVIVEGEKNKKKIRYTYDIFDRFDEKMNATSMSRTTGYPNAIMARLVLDGRIKQSGVHAPEIIAKDEKIFMHILKELENRNIKIKSKIEEI